MKSEQFRRRFPTGIREAQKLSNEPCLCGKATASSPDFDNRRVTPIIRPVNSANGAIIEAIVGRHASRVRAVLRLFRGRVNFSGVETRFRGRWCSPATGWRRN
ncbi:hypothetical protein WN51_06146 [Melipona quadrifasciata]|uniref:Uncharacterized protein n=1 Tax=Melipona quadrifasciata TaxID=166423 RepID=A0A0N1IT15_9HYME|nr:hypothetical protein WN51_06146 [Melipona quadrifasciata]